MRVINILAFSALTATAVSSANAQALEKDNLIEWLGKDAQTQAMYGPFKTPSGSERTSQRVYVKADCTMEITYGWRPASGGKLAKVEQALFSLKTAKFLILPGSRPSQIRVNVAPAVITFNTDRGGNNKTTDTAPDITLFVAAEKRAAVVEALTKIATICGKEK